VSNLEPDLGQSTALTNPLSAPTITPTAPSALAPRLPDDLQAKIQANLNQSQTPAAVTPATAQPDVIDTTGLDTNAIILNLPNARKGFVAKYNRLGAAVKNLPQPVRESLVQMDLDRVNKGQSPLNDQETLAAIITATKHTQATKPKEKGLLDEIMSLPSNAVKDATGILSSIPHIPGALLDTAGIVGNTFKHSKIFGDGDYSKSIIDQRYKAARAAGDNPIKAFLNLPVANLVPGTTTAANLTNGTEGLREIVKHPVGTALDVLPYAGKAAKMTEIGKLAEAERAANISRTTPIRAVLGKKMLPEETMIGSHLQGTARMIPGETSITGSRLVPGKLGVLTTPITKSIETGELGRIWGYRARTTATGLNQGDTKFTDILKGNRPLARADDQLARDAWRMAADKELSAKHGFTPERIRKVTDAIETDRNMFDIPGAFSDAERAVASDYIKLQKGFEDNWKGTNDLLEIGGEVYDAKAATHLRRMVEKSGKLEAKVDKGLATKVAGARKVLEGKLAADGKLSTVDNQVYKKIVPLSDMLDDYFGNPNTKVTIQELEKASRGLTAQRTRIGGASQVGSKVAPAGDIRIDTLARIRLELKVAAKQADRIDRFMAKAPARWHPNIQRLAADEGTQTLIQSGVDPMEAARVIAERDWDAYPGVMNKTVMDKLIKDTEPQWQMLKEAGIDPVYVHRVPIGRTRILKLPRLTDYVSRIGQVEGRSITDPSPYVHDITIAIAHQGAEMVAKRLSSDVLNEVGRTIGVREGSLLERVMPEARRQHALDPTKEVSDIANELIRETHVPYNPNTLINPQIRQMGLNPDQLWIPKNLAKNIEQYYHPEIGKILGVMKPINGMFRTSVLPFSMRWHLNNAIGNTIVMAVSKPSALLKLPEAVKEIKLFQKGEGTLPEDIGYSTGVSRKQLDYDRHELLNWEKGQRIAKTLQTIQESKIGRGFDAARQFSYDVNSAVDDFSRVATFLAERKTVLRKGENLAAANAAGLEAVNRYFQNWNAMTPVERNLLREVFPFYAFTSYAMRFVMEYPGMHPLRASIMSNMAEAEIRDMNESLPPEMMQYLALGGQDAHGDQSFLSTKGLNPFADTANQFTIKGFLSGLNPVGQAVAKSLGADLGQGGYMGRPQYDESTGKLTESKPGFLDSLISSTVPQIQFLTRKLGKDPEYNSLLRTNPAAAQRLLVSGIGLPAVYRSINIPETEMKSELARLTAQRNALKTALETGDYSEAMKWPGLRDQLRQIKLLRDSGQMTEYNPQAGAENTLAGAVKSVVPWPT